MKDIFASTCSLSSRDYSRATSWSQQRPSCCWMHGQFRGISAPPDRIGNSVHIGKQDRRSNNEKSSIATISSLLHLRRRDWQEAFRSMFHCWESKLKCLSPSAAFAAMTCDSNIILSVDASFQACRTECESLPKTPRIPTVIPRHTRPPMPSGRRTHSSSCCP